MQCYLQRNFRFDDFIEIELQFKSKPVLAIKNLVLNFSSC